MKIMIVEDNPDSRNLLMKQLQVYGHEVMAATNGSEALQQALENTPEIVISDIQMPEMDGYQLCREWKQSEVLKKIPFIIYTATYTRCGTDTTGISQYNRQCRVFHEKIPRTWHANYYDRKKRRTYPHFAQG